MDSLVTSTTNQLTFKEAENMIYTVIYYDEENNIRLWKKFANYSSAEQFCNENIDAELMVSMDEYKTLRNKLDRNLIFLKDIKDMIERNM